MKSRLLFAAAFLCISVVAAPDTPAKEPAVQTAARSAPLPVEGRLPSFDGATEWLNSTPLTPAALRGKVVLVDFWTYSCFNCLRTVPYVSRWHEKFRARGLTVIGVHTPEFGFEKSGRNVQAAIGRHGIKYPVALDNQYATWRAFDNEYWPAIYLIDRRGHLVLKHVGEGDYEAIEQAIETLVSDKGSD